MLNDTIQSVPDLFEAFHFALAELANRARAGGR
jgi:hypothetical protein